MALVKVNVFPMSDHRKLSELNLPKENFLYLLTPTNSEEAEAMTTNGEPETPPGGEDENADFVILVTDELQGRDYNLKAHSQELLYTMKDLQFLRCDSKAAFLAEGLHTRQ